MPRLDKTGPLGKGSMSGRKLGNCNSITRPKFLGYGFRKNRQYKNIYLWHVIWLITSTIGLICYGLKKNKK